MYSSQSDDDQISPSGYFFDQLRTGDGRIIDFLTAVANLDFGATSLAYNELMSVQSEISGSSFSDQLKPILPKEFSFLDSQATSQLHFSPGVTDQPASAARAYKASIDAMEKITVTEGLKGAGAEAKEMPCKHWFHLPCIEKWLGKCTYVLPAVQFRCACSGIGDVDHEDMLEDLEEETRSFLSGCLGNFEYRSNS